MTGQSHQQINNVLASLACAELIELPLLAMISNDLAVGRLDPVLICLGQSRFGLLLMVVERT